jgi:hypothetical protein
VRLSVWLSQWLNIRSHPYHYKWERTISPKRIGLMALGLYRYSSIACIFFTVVNL